MVETLKSVMRNSSFHIPDIILYIEPSFPTDLASGDSTDPSLNSPEADDTQASDDDDDEQFRGVQEKEVKSHLAPKWPTRVFAVSCMMKLMQFNASLCHESLCFCLA